MLSSKSDSPHDHQFLLSTLPPSPQQRRLAAWVLLVLLAALLITAPFARTPLTNTEILLPAYATAVLVNDLITAVLLFALYSIQPTRSLLALAVGYLYAALTIVPWVLTFPGVFAPAGLLDAGLQSTASIAALRRTGFPLFVLVYVLLKDADSSVPGARGSVRANIAGSVVATVGIVCALTWLIVESDDLLPRLMVDTAHVSEAWQFIPIAASLLSGSALILLWVRQRSVLDLWLMIVLCAFLIEILLLAVLSSGRFSLGWWAGRIYGLIAATVVLLVLLSETTTLYVRLQRSVAAERRAQEARLTTLEALSASIAHEVNQPLASVVTNADAGLRWLHKTTPDLDEARAALKRIVADGHRASKVIESIRTVFKTGPRERAPLDINELIQEVLSHMQAETQLRRVFVQTDFDQRLPVVAGNPVQLQQVLLNLITNAIDAMSSVANGARILRVKSELQGADRVLISVADSGCGLDPKHQDRIFEPFFTTKGHGMGMGLMICRSIVESHGGRLWMSNSDRQGAIFQFTLPAVMADSSSTARRAR